MAKSMVELPEREGNRPATTPTNPHTQLDQHPDPGYVQMLADRIFRLPGVSEQPSSVSVPGARALVLKQRSPTAPEEAFMLNGEFCHLHPLPDGSLHMALPPELARAAIDQAWAEVHPVARRGWIPPNTVLVYAPRNEEEVDVVANLVTASYRFARGDGARG